MSGIPTRLMGRIPDDVDEVLAAAAGTLFGKFAASLRRDFEAISAALVLPWRPARSKVRSAGSRC